MDLTTWIILTAVSLALSALFSGVEIAFVTSDRVRTELDVARGGLISRIIDRFYADGEFFISSILVGNNIMLVIYGMGAAALLEPWLSGIFSSTALVLLAQTVISTTVILLTGEFIPKTVFRINPNSSLKIYALPVFVFYLLLYPISWFATFLSKMLMRIAGIKSAGGRMRVISMGELNDFIEENIDTMEEKHTEVESEVKIFQNALDFSHTRLRDCMTPRNELVAVNLESITRDELCELFTTSGRSKILVYKGDIDSIVGYIHVSEMFDIDTDWHTRIKPVLFAPENLLANKMMRRLLQQKKSLAVVIDEFGGTAGLIALEDLVEEIFGDIQDEHDKSKLVDRNVAPGIYELSGRCEIEAINEEHHLNLPEDEGYQTIAGYILNATGEIPRQGDTVMIDGLRFDILATAANRLELIRLTLPEQQPDERT